MSVAGHAANGCSSDAASAVRTCTSEPSGSQSVDSTWTGDRLSKPVRERRTTDGCRTRYMNLTDKQRAGVTWCSRATTSSGVARCSARYRRSDTSETTTSVASSWSPKSADIGFHPRCGIGLCWKTSKSRRPAWLTVSGVNESCTSCADVLPMPSCANASNAANVCSRPTPPWRDCGTSSTVSARLTTRAETTDAAAAVPETRLAAATQRWQMWVPMSERSFR
jgi:hypothetical protein